MVRSVSSDADPGVQALFVSECSEKPIPYTQKPHGLFAGSF